MRREDEEMTTNSFPSDYKDGAGIKEDMMKTRISKRHYGLRRVSRGMPRIGLIWIMMIGLTISTHSLKIEDEEGNLIYEDSINTSLKVVDAVYNDSRTLGDDIWDIAKIV